MNPDAGRPSDAELVSNVHMLLLDPVEEVSKGGAETRQAFRAARVLIALIQLGAAISAVSLVISHLAQNKNRPSWCYDSLEVWYVSNAALSFCSAASGCVYAWVAVHRRRPWFVHLAGWYMFANTLGSAFMTFHLHETCNYFEGQHAIKETLRSMIIPGLAFSGLSCMLLQGAILLKVEALRWQQAVGLRSILIAVAVAGTAFLILEGTTVMRSYSSIWMLVSSLLAFIMFLFVFTARAMLELLRCQDLIDKSNLAPELHYEHKRTIRLHAFTTATANGTLMSFLVALAFRIKTAKDSISSWAFVATHVFDNACNILCMVLFSGMTSAACGRGGGDVLRTIASAGHAAQLGASATTYGRENAAGIELS